MLDLAARNKHIHVLCVYRQMPAFCIEAIICERWKGYRCILFE